MAGNWFDAIGKAMDEGRNEKLRLDAEATERSLKRAQTTANDNDTLFREALALAEKRGNIIRELQAQIQIQNRTINTLHEEITFLTEMVRAENKALIQATGDVAQLVGIDPHVVATRYKLAAIDLIQREMDGGVLDVKYGESEWTNGVSFGEKMNLRMRQMKEYNHLVQNKGASYSEALDGVREKFKKRFDNATDCYYWLDWNPELFYSAANPDIMNGYKAIDDLMVRAINLKSECVPEGKALVDKSGQLTQRADSLEGAYKEGDVVKGVGMHPWVQENVYKNWNAPKRHSGFSGDQYKATATQLGQFLSKKNGFDITRDDAVKPPIKNKDQQSNPPAPNEKGH